MSKTLCAFTLPDQPIYPSFFNVVQQGEHVIVTVRSAPTFVPGIRICGQDCLPGEEGCNNYCGLAPQKGPIADRAEACVSPTCGETARVRMPRAIFDQLIREAIAD